MTISAQKHTLSPRFRESLSEPAPLKIKNHAMLQEFWQPEPPNGYAFHPLEVVKTYHEAVWAKIRDGSEKARTDAFLTLSETGGTKQLDGRSISEESAFWCNSPELEWQDLSRRIEDYLSQGGWSLRDSQTFCSEVYESYIRYKRDALGLFAYRRSGELTYQAHYHGDFTQAQEVIRQWLQPAWFNNALEWTLAEQKNNTPARIISPMDYYDSLRGVSFLTNAFLKQEGWDTSDYLDYWFLVSKERSLVNKSPLGGFSTKDSEQKQKKAVSRAMHELFAQTFTREYNNSGERLCTTGLWLNVPTAACLQMWLDIEKTFRNTISEVLMEKGILQRGENWHYRLKRFNREGLGEKVEVISRMSARFKSTWQSNHLHCREILSSQIYKTVLKDLSIANFRENKNDVLYRICLLSYGRNVPFFPNLPQTEGTLHFPDGPCPTVKVLSDIGIFNPPPADAPRDETAYAEWDWKTEAADMRVQAGISTPKMELLYMLDDLDRSGKHVNIENEDPGPFVEHFMYYSITGSKGENEYIRMKDVWCKQWKQSEQSWDDEVLFYTEQKRDCPHIAALVQHWLGDSKWDLFHHLQERIPSLTTLVENAITGLLDVYKGAVRPYWVALEHLENFSLSPENDLNEITRDSGTLYKARIKEGADFIRFNIIMRAIHEAYPFLDDIYRIPEQEESCFLLEYIIPNFSGALKYEAAAAPEYTAMGSLLTATLKNLAQGAGETLGYAENEVENTSLGDIVF